MSDIIFVVFGLVVIFYLYYICNKEYKEYLNDCKLLERYYEDLQEFRKMKKYKIDDFKD